VCIYGYSNRMTPIVELSDYSRPTDLSSAEVFVAEALGNAIASGVTIAPPRLIVPNPDLASGYRIQALNVRRWQAIGRRVVGHKIGMTSTAIQKQFGIDHPTRGILFESMVHTSGARISFPVACSQARVEGEIAFVLRDDVNAVPATVDLLDAIDYALPAIELVNSRIAQWDVTAFDFVADNAAAAFVILGTERIDCSPVSLTTSSMKMNINGQTRAVGVGADCLGSPLHALRWLAADLLENDDLLKKGDIVMSGSLGPAVRITAGDLVDMYLNDGGAVTVRVH